MRTVVRSVVVVSCVFALGAGVAQAEDAKTAQPPVDPDKQAAMEKMKQLGSPSEGHKALEPFVGTWSAAGKWWMSPDAPAEPMTGSATNALAYGGRFLRQDFNGDATKDFPAFEGLGYTGYDNIRKEYQSVWLDNMGTGMMWATGQYDAASKTLTLSGDFSCPMTGEAHRWFRSTWKVVDDTHHVYESYAKTPDGKEFKSMEMTYTKQ